MNVEALFKQYYPRLRNYACRFVGSVFVAEDKLLYFFENLPTFVEKADTAPYR